MIVNKLLKKTVKALKDDGIKETFGKTKNYLDREK